MEFFQKLFNLPEAKGKIVLWRKGRKAIYVEVDQIPQIPSLIGTDNWYFGATLQDQAKAGKRSTNVGATCITHVWADIDLDAKSEIYPSVEEMRELLSNFPIKPSVMVDSGNGFHVYWIFDKAYPPDQTICKRLQLLLNKKLKEINPDKKIDLTGDLARVLRVPGTKNVSGANGDKIVKEVKVLGDTGIRHSLEDIKRVLDEEGIEAKGQKEKAPKDSILKSMGMLDTQPGIKPSIHEIARECPQIADRLKDGGASANEPLWYPDVALAAYTMEGDEALKLVAGGHPGFDLEESKIKQMQWLEKTDGPPTCAKYTEENGVLCEGCKHKGVITTPVQLGQQQKIDIPELNIDLGEQWHIPFPFVIGQDKKLKVVTDVSDEGIKTYTTVYNHQILPTSRIWDEQTNQEYVTFKAELPRDGWRDCEFPTSLIAEPNGLLKTFASIGVVVQPDVNRWFHRYIVASVNQMQAQSITQVAHSNMGWRADDSFVFKNTCFTKEGPLPARLSPALDGVSDNLGEAGSKEVWIATFDKVCSVKKLDHHKFAAFAAFAAPLLRAMDFPGVIYNLYSTQSSTFKSFFLKVITSIYGKPTDSLVLRRDSEKSKYKIVSGRCDLPTIYDEITNIEIKDLSDFCYSVSQGRMHHRLERDSTLRKNTDEWRTILVSSSNKSLHELLFSQKGAAFGEAMRVLEVNVAKGRKAITNDRAALLMDKFNNNYGIVGREWLHYLATNKDEVFTNVREVYSVISRKVEVDPQERFWVATVAAIITASLHTRKLGFHKVPPKFFADYGMSLLETMRLDIVGEKRKLSNPLEVLQHYIAKRMARNAFVEAQNDIVVRTPTADLTMRVDEKNNLIWIQSSDFVDFCINRGVDSKGTVLALKQQNVLARRTITCRMGKNEFSNIRLRCIQVNMDLLQSDPMKAAEKLPSGEIKNAL